MTENELATIVVDIAYKIHTRLGPGLLESAYEAILAHELKKRGLSIEVQKPIPMVWDGAELGVGFRTDIVVQGKLIVELKSIEEVVPVHKKQLRTYLLITGCKLGLLINFNVELIKDGISRVVNGL
jgi:GxxExxY protein